MMGEKTPNNITYILKELQPFQFPFSSQRFFEVFLGIHLLLLIAWNCFHLKIESNIFWTYGKKMLLLKIIVRDFGSVRKEVATLIYILYDQSIFCLEPIYSLLKYQHAQFNHITTCVQKLVKHTLKKLVLLAKRFLRFAWPLFGHIEAYRCNNKHQKESLITKVVIVGDMLKYIY